MLRSTNERLGVKNLEHGAPALGQLPSANEPLDPYAEGGGGDGGGEAPVDPYGAGTSAEPVDPYAVAPASGGAAGSGGASTGKVDSDAGWSARDSRNWSMLSGGAWGAYTVALFGDVVSDNSSGGEIAGYALAGGLIGAGVGYLYGTKLEPSAADLSLVNSFAAYGTAVGLFLAVAIDPPKNEAYTLQGALGSMVGIGAGYYLSKRAEISPRRMMWIDVGAASGAVASWALFYPLISDSASNNDEQTTGLVTVAAMAAGAYLAYRFTRKMDAGKPATKPTEPPMVGLLQRSSRGEWGVGVPLLRPMDNPALAPRSAGLSLGVDVLGGRF
jgi:hypothetical protein